MNQFKEKLLGLTKLRYKTLPLLFQNMQPDEALNIGDPISRILKCHLLSEVVLDKLIQFVFEPNGDAILSAKLTYAKKLSIVSKSMLVEDYPLLPDFVVGSLRRLNMLRNRLSHELVTTVTQDEVIDLFMGVDHPMPFDPKNADVPLLIYHYTSFIFGNMLPKYEDTEE
jgi:hypothetical protein